MSRRGVLLTALWPLPVFCVLGLALFGGERARAPLPVFLDTTAKAGITFQLLSSRTPQKYLIESMPGGVAMLDYDGDGFEDLFFVNGARLQNPMPPGAVPDKSDPKYWNRLYHNNGDGTFTAETGQDHALRQKIHHDAPPRGANGLAQADFARPLGDRNQHDVQDPHATQRQRDHRDGSQERGHRDENLVHQLGALHGVPDVHCALVVRIELVIAPQHPQNLLARRLPFSQRGRHVDDVVDDAGMEIIVVGRQVADHGRVGHVDFIAVQTVVAAVLVLGRHQADDAERQTIQEDLRARRGVPFAEQLLADVIAQYGHALGIGFVGIYQEAAPSDGYGADLGIQWLDAIHCERSAVVSTGHLRAILQLADHPADQIAFRAYVVYVVVSEANPPTGALSAHLLLRAAGKQQHDVLAKLLGVVALALREAVPHGYDQDDRSHAPGDSRHGQKAAELVAEQAGCDLRQ